MRKYIKYIIIIFSVIILSTVIYLAVDSSESKKESALSGVVTLSEFDSEKLESMTVTNESGTYEFIYKDGEWQWADEENAPFTLNDIMLNQIAGKMADLQSEKVVTENPENISQYGFDNPIKIECYAQNNTYSIELGSINPTATSYYIKKTDSNTIYTIDNDTAQYLLNDRNSLKDPYLFGVSSMDLTKIKLIRNDEVIFDVEKNENKVWELIAPTYSLSPNLTKFSTYDALLTKAMAYTYIEENPSDLSLYGLDKPSYIIEAETADENARILFGNEPADYPQALYAMVETSKSKDVVVIYKNNLGFLDISTSDILSEYINNISMSHVSAVDISIDGQKVRLDIDFSENEYFFDGVQISDDERIKLYDEFFGSFNLIKVSGTDLSAEPDISGIPQLEIKYTLDDGSEINSAYYKDDESDVYYLVKDGIYTGAVVSADAVMEIKGAYAGIRNRVSESSDDTSEPEITEEETSVAE